MKALSHYAPPRLHILATAILTGWAAVSLVNAAELPAIQFVNGKVDVVHADGSRDLAKKGYFLKPGDRLSAGEHGMVQVRALNQGVVALRANSEIEFKPSGESFDVSLIRGQLRAVSDMHSAPDSLLKVVTSDSKISVGAGDIETGIVPGGEGGQTFSRVHSGTVKLDAANGGGLIQPGQLVKTGDGVKPLEADQLPDLFKAPVVALNVNQDGPASSATMPNGLANAPLPTDGLKPTSVLPVLVALQQPLIPNLPNTAVELTKLPEIKVEFAEANVAGASNSFNEALAKALPVLIAGRKDGNSANTLTPVADADIPQGALRTKFQLTESVVTLPNNDKIATLATDKGSVIIPKDGVATNNLVAFATAAAANITATRATDLKTTNSIITPVTNFNVNPITTPTTATPTINTTVNTFVSTPVVTNTLTSANTITANQVIPKSTGISFGALRTSTFLRR